MCSACVLFECIHSSPVKDGLVDGRENVDRTRQSDTVLRGKKEAINMAEHLE